LVSLLAIAINNGVFRKKGSTICQEEDDDTFAREKRMGKYPKKEKSICHFPDLFENGGMGD